MSIYKSALRNTSTYFVAMMAKRLVSFLLLPIYTRYLTTADYGALELLNLIYILFSTLLGMQFSSSLFYFFFKAPNQEARDETVSNAFVGAGIVGCSVAVLGWFSAPYLSILFFQTSVYTHAIRLVLVGYAFALPLEMGAAYIKALNRSGTYVFVSVGQLILQMTLNISLIVYFRMGFIGAIWGDLVSTGVVGIFLTFYSLSGTKISFQSSTFLKFVRYCLPFGVGGLSMMLVHFGDRFFLQRNVSLGQLGIYALSYKLGMLIENLLTPFAIYWNSQVFDIVKRPEGERVYVRFCTYVTLTLTFAAVGLTVFARPVLRVMVAPAFQDAATYAPWIAFAYVLRAIDQHFRAVFRVQGKTGREARVLIVGAVTSVIAYATLIPPFKLWGAVIATILGFTSMLVYGFREAQKVRSFPFEFGRLAKIAAAAAITIGLFYWSRSNTFWAEVALGLGFTALFPALLWAGRFFTDEELRILKSSMSAIQRFGPLRLPASVRGVK